MASYMCNLCGQGMPVVRATLDDKPIHIDCGERYDQAKGRFVLVKDYTEIDWDEKAQLHIQIYTELRGWKHIPENGKYDMMDTAGKVHQSFYLPDCTEDLTAAFDLVEEFNMTVSHMGKEVGQYEWHVSPSRRSVGLIGENRDNISAGGPTACIAICRAALKAVRRGKEFAANGE